jgi:hypothetical protein
VNASVPPLPSRGTFAKHRRCLSRRTSAGHSAASAVLLSGAGPRRASRAS